MKKKIVYISGAEVFDVNEVRAAFDEVRSTLNLDADTILFGVPVDAETESNRESSVAEVAVNQVNSATDMDSGTQETFIESEQIESEDDDDAPVVPILSVLGGGSEEITQAIDTSDEKNKEEPQNENESIIECDSEITEMLNDDLPDDPSEKTLEELLETMTPLREDVQPEQVSVDEKDSEVISEDQVDATLENLASEFANAQVNVSTPKKGSERGRIGKLKNILPLPFKKIKRDDTGIMGDLFGWAGIAANDEDFTIPGFFTNAVGRK